MALLGAGQQRIEQARATLQEPIRVHPNNWTTVQVFRLIPIPVIASFSGIAHVPPPLVEMRIAAGALRERLTPRIILGIRVMADAWCAVKNAAKN